MLKQSIFSFVVLAVVFTPASGKDKSTKKLSTETVNFLEARGFEVVGMHKSIRPPSRDPEKKETEPENVEIEVSLDLSKINIKPIYMGTGSQTRTAGAASDSILVEDFEGEFPGDTWQLSGDPTWGKTDARKHSGSYSVWCAAGGDSAVTPGDGYPNNMNAMMVFGPFDLSDVNYAELSFSYWLDTEYQKDWFIYMVSTDGLDFSGIALSGQTSSSGGSWETEVLPLINVPGLGNATGKSQVWISFLFETDNISTSDKGVYVDKVSIEKRQVEGTPVTGSISGIWSSSNSPYIVLSRIMVPQGDSLIIEAGTLVDFRNGSGLTITGSLQAIGTEVDSITFTSTSGTWAGLTFNYPSDNNLIEYCIVEKTFQDNLYFDESKATIKNCTIRDGNKNGIAGRASELTITDSNILDNNGAGIRNSMHIRFGFIGNFKVIRNVILRNGSGIANFSSDLFVKNNLISKNSGFGVNVDGGWVVLDENEITQNGSGIRISINLSFFHGDVVVKKNVISDNKDMGILIPVASIPTYICNNFITTNSGDGIRISMGIFAGWSFESEFNVYNNTIYANGGSGIEVYAGQGLNPGTNTFINNIITQNKDFGIFCKKIQRLTTYCSMIFLGMAPILRLKKLILLVF